METILEHTGLGRAPIGPRPIPSSVPTLPTAQWESVSEILAQGTLPRNVSPPNKASQPLTEQPQPPDDTTAEGIKKLFAVAYPKGYPLSIFGTEDFNSAPIKFLTVKNTAGEIIACSGVQCYEGFDALGNLVGTHISISRVVSNTAYKELRPGRQVIDKVLSWARQSFGKDFIITAECLGSNTQAINLFESFRFKKLFKWEKSRSDYRNQGSLVDYVQLSYFSSSTARNNLRKAVHSNYARISAISKNTKTALIKVTDQSEMVKGITAAKLLAKQKVAVALLCPLHNRSLVKFSHPNLKAQKGAFVIKGQAFRVFAFAADSDS